MCLYVYNRSLLLTNQNDPKKRLCATILTPHVELAEAQFTDPAGRISGKIVIMSNEYSGDLQVSLRLWFIIVKPSRQFIEPHVQL